MSFLTDLFHGNFGNLGNDLFGSPTAIAETLGAVAAPLALFAAPEILGASLLPTAGEGVLGAAAGEAAPASLGAAFGGAGDLGALAAEDTSTALSAFPTQGTAAVPNISGFPAGSAVNFADLPAASGPAYAPNPVVPDFANASLTGLPGADTTQSLLTATGDLTTPTGGGFPAAPAADTTAGAAPFSYSAPGTGGDVISINGVGGATAPAGGAPAAPGGFMGALNTVGGYLKAAAPIAGVAGLGANLYSGYEQRKQLADLSQTEATLAGNARLQADYARGVAQPLIASGEDLMHYINTGTLPAPFQAQLKQIVAANKARIIQGYATRGMPTDPTRNSGLAQDLANADQQAMSLKADLETKLAQAGDQMVSTANQLLAQGLSATQLGAQIPILMQRLTMDINNETAKAIASFAGAMNSGQGTGRPLAA